MDEWEDIDENAPVPVAAVFNDQRLGSRGGDFLGGAAGQHEGAGGHQKGDLFHFIIRF